MGGVKDMLSPHDKTWGDTSPHPPRDLRPCVVGLHINITTSVDYSCLKPFHKHTHTNSDTHRRVELKWQRIIMSVNT